MRTMTAKMLTGSIAVALAISASVGFAGPRESGIAATFGAAAVGQAGSISPQGGDKQGQCDDLLRRARQAMAANDLPAAEALITQAETLAVDYGPFHFGDTPKKARRDLERRRGSGGEGAGAASTLGAGAIKKTSPVSDPFAARAASPLAAGNPGAEVPRRLPPINQTSPETPGKTSPFAAPTTAEIPGANPATAALRPGTQPSAAPANGPSAAANQALLNARKALALGDTRRATSFLTQAKGMPSARGPQDDSPENFEATLRKYNDLVAMPAERRTSEAYRREYARVLLEQAEGLLRRGDFDEAERLARVASRQQATFGPLEARPEIVLERINAARRQGKGQFVTPATAASTGNADTGATTALYNANNDPTRNIAVNNIQAMGEVNSPTPAPTLAPQAMQSTPTPAGAMPANAGPGGENVGMQLFEQGEAALRARDTATAMKLFREAVVYRDQLDPITAQRLQDHIQLIAMTTPAPVPHSPGSSMAEETAAKQQLLLKQVQAEVIQEESAAKAMVASDAKRAVAMIEQLRQKVEAAGLEQTARDQLLRRIDRTLGEMRQFVADNRPRIELEEKNQKIRAEVSKDKQAKLANEEKLAALVNDYNRLLDEQRYEEAEVLAKRARELDPENPVVVQLEIESKFIHRHMNNMDIVAKKEQGFIDTLASVERSAIPYDDSKPYMHGPAKEWSQLSATRAKQVAALDRRRSERDLDVERKLKTPVSLHFENAPLSKVVEYLGKLAEVNVHLDAQGMADEGVTSESPVTIKLDHEVSLKSALRLILQPLHLNYVVKNEVLLITSEQLRDGEVYTATYNVADLVIPIPNFVPSPEMGLAGSLRSAMSNVGYGGLGGAAPMAVLASKDGSQGGSGAINPAVLAQMPGSHGGSVPFNSSGGPPTLGAGPGGAGGGSQADFDPLIQLITSTIQPSKWVDMGGLGSIKPFVTNLSIVVSQTQEVHQEIADVLEQLRRLQDLQVTIEVRFITLQDNFFERIGVDFDFNLNSNIDKSNTQFGKLITPVVPGSQGSVVNQGPVRDLQDPQSLNRNNSMVVGLTAPSSTGVSQFSSDLDVPFHQGSFGLPSQPLFGGYAASTGAQLGFAILSEIEAYFFLEAATADVRTNVLQAPKVTLFNGQQAFVSDTSQSPFVITVIPVVGDFAAAQQPVIVVLSEGTFLTVQAVVSPDRRFVRLTVVPFFSKIGDVKTFTFNGRTTTTNNTSTEGPQETPTDATKKSNQSTTTSEGTTVQLPTFSFVTVTTTVSVPDGGTVLLGGIKRLKEGRNEAGVPMLDKIPYLSRLFKNTSIGRETQSLMMMVTPRIIIQEEEEDKIGSTSQP